MRQLSVLHVATVATTRVYKQIISTHSVYPDIRISLVAKAIGHPELQSMISPWCPTYNPSSASAIDALVHQHNVVHLHSTIADVNEIRHLAGRYAGSHASVIWDIHDYVGGTDIPAGVKAVIPSKGYKLYIPEAVTVYSKTPSCLHTRGPQTYDIPYTVLATGLERNVPFRDYSELNRFLDGKLFVMVGNRNASGFSNELMTMECSSYQTMVGRFSRFEQCWAGSNLREEWNDIVTNKFWDYLAGGVEPKRINTYGCSEMGELLMAIRNGEEDILGETEARKLVTLYQES